MHSYHIGRMYELGFNGEAPHIGTWKNKEFEVKTLTQP